MITKETIAQYCVDSKGSKDLAEAIAKQFERAGFHRWDGQSQSPSTFVGIGEVTESIRVPLPDTAIEKHKRTTLSELTKMVDELVGDEYDLVREFIEWHNLAQSVEDKLNSEACVRSFSKYRANIQVTLDDLKAAYAKQEGIEVSKIVVKD